MKIAICNETYRDWSFEDAFRHASQCGFEGIEIAPFTLQKNANDITQSQIDDVVALAAQYDLQIVGLHWLLAFTEGLHLTSSDDSIRQKTAGYLGQLAAVCRQLGGGVMVFGSPDQRSIQSGITVQQANDLAIDCIRRLLPALQEHNVTLALEPLGPEEGDFLLTAEWGRQLVTELDSEFVKLHLDVKAMSTESESIPDIIAASKQELVHFHANDPNRRGPGMGDVEYEPIVAALVDIEYDGWLSVEVFDESVAPEVLAAESVEYLKRQLVAAGVG